MTCTEKDRDTCNVEKMGCEGCAYYESDKEEGEKAKVKERRMEFKINNRKWNIEEKSQRYIKNIQNI